MKMSWRGVMPATTTAFDEKLEIDHGFVAKHAAWLIDNGCTAIVAPGSLGESATLSFEEKVALWSTLVAAVGERVPVVAAIASLSTAEAVALAKRAAEGVGVRLLLDDVGSWRVGRRFLAPLTAAGAKVAFFMPMLHLPFRGRTNLRNHRKIVVVDSRHALTGGMNLAAGDF